MQGDLGFGGRTLGIIQVEQSVGEPEVRLHKIRLGGERLPKGSDSTLPVLGPFERYGETVECRRVVRSLLQACLISFRGSLELTLLVEGVARLSLIVGVVSRQAQRFPGLSGGAFKVAVLA